MSTPLALQQPDSRLCLRSVRQADAPLLRERCWPERSLPAVQRTVARAVRIEAQGYGLGIVADVADGVIGYGQCTFWPRCGEISDVIVWDRWRGQGAGTAIIQYLSRAARDRQARCLEIGAAWTNHRALALYRRLGFHDHRTMGVQIDGQPVSVLYLRLNFTG
jgi:GNAT superfamily N-acetyltransferase